MRTQEVEEFSVGFMKDVNRLEETLRRSRTRWSLQVLALRSQARLRLCVIWAIFIMKTTLYSGG